MQIVTYPPAFIDAYLTEARALLESGSVAEGRYFREECEPFVPDRHALPVCSGGAGLFALLAFHRHTRGKKVAIVQSNTMRALYTVPKLLDMTPVVVESSYDDFLAMRPEALEQTLASRSVAAEAVVIYSVIGGYLSPSLERIVQICQRANVPLVIDGAHAHYLDALHRLQDVDISYSFYATKILPAGEGGLIVSGSAARISWLRRFAIYDRFENSLQVGLNLRAGELTSAFMHRLMTDPTVRSHFKEARIEIAERYRSLCQAHGLRYLDPHAATEYNGYKLVILSPRADLEPLGTPLTEHAATSAVFATDVLGQPTLLPHWCPPTYPSLALRHVR